MYVRECMYVCMYTFDFFGSGDAGGCTNEIFTSKGVFVPSQKPWTRFCGRLFSGAVYHPTCVYYVHVDVQTLYSDPRFWAPAPGCYVRQGNFPATVLAQL